MNLLVVTNMYPTEAEPWFGSFVRDQVEDLRALGLDVEVLAFDGRRHAREYGRAARRARQLAGTGRFDVVHAHYGLSGAVALAQRSVPVVTTFHGSDTGGVAWQRFVSAAVARIAVPIFVNRIGARLLWCRGGHVIPAGVDTNLFTPAARPEARRDLGWSEDRRYVLFPGSRRNRVKRPDLFAAVIEKLGPAQERVEPVYLENLSRAQAAATIAAADVTLVTSDWEGSPVTVRESLACETPVVSVPVGDVEETLEGLPGCEIAPRDPDELAAAVRRALAAGRSGELRERALATSRQRTAERVAAVYDEVLAR
ncbi:MAG TPA: glycosyltransferase [Gaiellaceae bacterium]|nr:glycosyltransferase [Gaiellaceae bacterium]